MSRTIKIKDTQTLEDFNLESNHPLNIYICGPTVYTESHVGHLKTYMTFDIIRRIFKNYFGLNTRYMMNITNVDDKIIRATYEKEYPDKVNDKYDLNSLEKSEYLPTEKFEEYADFWENKFFEVLDDVNIEKPDILSRVTEYLPEILDFVDKIYENGYAFEKDGSVYFDGIKYRHDKKISDNYLEEKESDESHNPLSKHNFVLLKKAKLYEPGWDSKWGRVRPGWHIECSAMASSVFGNTVDIHGGGIDLAFPHHHNEVTQSDARFYPNKNKTWVRHFMHTGHLNIKGLKMSRSLKNFITIKDILKDYTSDQLRMLFLLHMWSAPMDYSEETMTHAIFYVDFFKNFEKQIRTIKLKKNNFVYKKYGDLELKLSEIIAETNKLIDINLRDNLNTQGVIKNLQNLVSDIYQYVESVESNPNDGLCTQLIYIGYNKVVDTLNMFGLTLFESNSTSGLEDKLIKVVYDIRSDIRTLAKDISKKSKNINEDAKSNIKEIVNSLFNLTDDIRDNKMKSIGIDLVDKRFD